MSYEIEKCRDCIFFDLKGIDKRKFAACCINPPRLELSPSGQWLSSRAFTSADAPMCLAARDAMAANRRRGE